MKTIKKLVLAAMFAVFGFCGSTWAVPAPETDFGFESATITSYKGAGGDVEIPATIGGVEVNTIAMTSFANNGKLTAVTIPAGVTSIAGEAFAMCSGLESITFADGSKLNSIGYGMLFSCTALTAVTIPAGVTSIGASAFAGCGKLEVVTVLATEPPSAGESLFDNNTLASLKVIRVPEGSVDKYKKTQGWSLYADLITDKSPFQVRNVRFQQRYPWDGLVDVLADVYGPDTNDIELVVKANVGEEEVVLSALHLYGQEDSWNRKVDLTNGLNEVRFVWDAGAELPGAFYSVDFTLGVGIAVPKSQKEPEPPEEDAFCLVGSFNGWNAADTAYQMDNNGGVYAGIIGIDETTDLKIVANGSWDLNFGREASGTELTEGVEYNAVENGGNIALSVPGTYTIVLDVRGYNKDTHEGYATIIVKKLANLQVVGSFNEWDLANGAVPMTCEAGVYTCTLALEANDEIKVNDGTWTFNFGSASTYPVEPSDAVFDGWNIKVLAAGTYKVTLDISNCGFQYERGAGYPYKTISRATICVQNLNQLNQVKKAERTFAALTATVSDYQVVGGFCNWSYGSGQLMELNGYVHTCTFVLTEDDGSGNSETWNQVKVCNGSTWFGCPDFTLGQVCNAVVGGADDNLKLPGPGTYAVTLDMSYFNGEDGATICVEQLSGPATEMEILCFEWSAPGRLDLRMPIIVEAGASDKLAYSQMMWGSKLSGTAVDIHFGGFGAETLPICPGLEGLTGEGVAAFTYPTETGRYRFEHVVQGTSPDEAVGISSPEVLVAWYVGEDDPESVYAYADGTGTVIVQGAGTPKSYGTGEEPWTNAVPPITQIVVPTGRGPEFKNAWPEYADMITEPELLRFTARGDGVAIGMEMMAWDAIEPPALETAMDPAGPWAAFTAGETTIPLAADQAVYFRRSVTTPTTAFSIDWYNYWRFTMTPQEEGVTVEAGGNVMSLIDQACTSTAVGQSAFCNLFEGCTVLTTAPELPAMVLADGCYYGMFGGCTSLTNAPALSATTLATNCYYSMFNGCTSLTEAPVLPATTLAKGCYNAMFSRCTALTNAPALPATTLAPSCYSSMFYGCTSLTNAPALPAATLAPSCYSSMFYGCTSLTNAPALPAATLADNCYFSMFEDCTALMEAPALPATTLAEGCYESMFAGCTSLTEPPALPATMLADDCYHSMFEDCSSLTEAPALPATMLAGECYQSMFLGCTSLTTAPELLATTLAERCYDAMFEDCTALTTAPALPATKLAEGCYGEMFSGCTALPNTPALSATMLAKGCYGEMFSDCTSLTEAPALPATTLTNDCYHSMFRGCTSLTNAPTLPATALAESCYHRMFLGCASLTIAPVLPATTLAESCYYAMFQECTSLTTAPVLPAMTLVEECYAQMFYGCTNLAEITMLATDIPFQKSLQDWVKNVAPTGVFKKNPAMTTLTEGPDGIPTGWTVVNVYPSGTPENPWVLTDPSGDPTGWAAYTNKNNEVIFTGEGPLPSGFANEPPFSEVLPKAPTIRVPTGTTGQFKENMPEYEDKITDEPAEKITSLVFTALIDDHDKKVELAMPTDPPLGAGEVWVWANLDNYFASGAVRSCWNALNASIGQDVGTVNVSVLTNGLEDGCFGPLSGSSCKFDFKYAKRTFIAARVRESDGAILSVGGVREIPKMDGDIMTFMGDNMLGTGTVTLPYYAWDEDARDVVLQAPVEAIQLTDEMTELEDGKWYVLIGTWNFNALAVSGNVHLICRESADAQFNSVSIAENASLSIYGETKMAYNSESCGDILFVESPVLHETATINLHGAQADMHAGLFGGTVNVYGGMLRSYSRDANPAIRADSALNVYGGWVMAVSEVDDGGTGSGIDGAVNIHGGWVEALGGEGAAGIGACAGSTEHGPLTIGDGLHVWISENYEDAPKTEISKSDYINRRDRNVWVAPVASVIQPQAFTAKKNGDGTITVTFPEPAGEGYRWEVVMFSSELAQTSIGDDGVFGDLLFERFSTIVQSRAYLASEFSMFKFEQDLGEFNDMIPGSCRADTLAGEGEITLSGMANLDMLLVCKVMPTEEKGVITLGCVRGLADLGTDTTKGNEIDMGDEPVAAKVRIVSAKSARTEGAWSGAAQVEYELSGLNAAKSYALAVELKAAGRFGATTNDLPKAVVDGVYTQQVNRTEFFGIESQVEDPAAELTLKLIEKAAQAGK